jgi:hypothetical protein
MPKPGQKREYMYHSVIAGSPNGIKLRIMGDVKESKYPDGNPYVAVELADGTEATFILENADIRGLVDNTPQKKWFTVKGEGKGPGAWMVVEDESGPVLPQQAPSAITRPETPKVVEVDAKNTDRQNIAAAAAELTIFQLNRMEVGGHPLDSAGKASVLNTWNIAMDRRS